MKNEETEMIEMIENTETVMKAINETDEQIERALLRESDGRGDRRADDRDCRVGVDRDWRVDDARGGRDGHGVEMTIDEEIKMGEATMNEEIIENARCEEIAELSKSENFDEVYLR